MWRNLVLSLFLAVPVIAQPIYPPATQQEVIYGTNRSKFVSPLTLAGWLTNGGTYDLSASEYIARALVTNETAKARVDGFIRTLKRYNLWDSLLDGCTLRASQQPSGNSNVYTFKNVLARLDTNWVTLDENGALLQSQYMAWRYPDTRTFTVVCNQKTFTNSYSALNTYMWQLVFTNGGSAPSMISLLQEAAADGSTHCFASAGADFVEGFPGGNARLDPTAIAPGVFRPDPQAHTVALCYQTNGALKAYVDGLYSVTNFIAAKMTGTNSLDEFVLNARKSGANTYAETGTRYCAFWLIFTNILTDAQALQVEEAVRWLNPNPVNWVFEGDSFTAFTRGVSNDLTYPSQLMTRGDSSNRAQMVNMAVLGEWTTNYLGYYSNQIQPLRPGRGGVTSSRLFLSGGGLNDKSGGTADNLIASNVVQLAAWAKRDGFDVTLILMPYTAFANMTAVNALLMTNRSYWEEVVRWDIMLGVTNILDFQDASLFYVNHPSMSGSAMVADAIATGKGKYRGHVFYDNGIYTNTTTASVTNNGYYILGGDLFRPRDAIEFLATGTTTNNANNKTIAVHLGSETVFTTGAIPFANAQWTIRGVIEVINPTSQRVTTSWFSGCPQLPFTNYVSLIAQTNRIVNRLYLSMTGGSTAEITNNLFRVEWKPLVE